MSAAQELRRLFFDYNALSKAIAMMNWDRQVLMAPGSGEARTRHVGTLSRLSHQLLTSDEMRKTVERAEAEAEAGSDDAAAARVVRRELDIQSKLPTDLVVRKSRVSSSAYEAWRKARASSDFALLRPFLEELFDIARETAELRGYGDHPYDALIDLFEESATHAQAKQIFDELKGPISQLVQELKDRGQTDDSFLKKEWDNEKLRAFGEVITKEIGFDYNRGRLDITTNAFCTNFSIGDVRMTTKPAKDLRGILFSSLHEMGHGLYEQNMPVEWDRTPLCGGISLGVHESQSRLWENIVGRSKPFWSKNFALLSETFPETGSVGVEQFYGAINRVQPGPIRIGSDELTYNLHILVRFEMESALITGEVEMKDAPDAWNEKYRQYLGVVPASDGEGILQDVHWSRGSVGYFPTYTMGNLMSWQIWRSLQKDLGDTDAMIASGNFMPILGWLTDKIYSQGKRYQPSDLLQRVTGEPMTARYYLEGMREKYS